MRKNKKKNIKTIKSYIIIYINKYIIIIHYQKIYYHKLD